jgi:hypothetical protein
MASEPPPSPGARPSVTAPLSSAIDWTRHVLFGPFDAGTWFTLGFCAWLASLGRQGGGAGVTWRGGELREQIRDTQSWVGDHLGLFLVLAVTVAAIGIVLTVLALWLSSRGAFMFLDGVVRGRGAVAEPWGRFREQAASLFVVRLVVTSIMAPLVLAVVATMFVAFVRAGGLGPEPVGWPAIAALLPFVLVLIPLVVLAGLAGLVIDDVMVPIQWLRGCRAMAAWREARELIAANAGAFVLYVSMRVVLAVAIGVLSCIAVCVTCCLVALPYLGTVILLPLHVFGRTYSIHFLAQLGPDYAPLGPRPVAFRAGAPPPEGPDRPRTGGPA